MPPNEGGKPMCFDNFVPSAVPTACVRPVGLDFRAGAADFLLFCFLFGM